MIEFNKVPVTGDPATNLQLFEKLKINIICCRYWWLDNWHSNKMAFPYWRLYWNKTPGACVLYKQLYELTPDTIVLIPPFTPFSTIIKSKENTVHLDYNLKGGWIRNDEEENEMMNRGSILHFFIHFNLGFPYDNYPAGIYNFDVTSELLSNIDTILQFMKTGEQNFNINASLNLYNLIISLVNKLPVNNWQSKSIDSRIKDTIDYILLNPGISENNSFFATRVKMATNSFARLFKENIGMTPHMYIYQTRIDKACELLHQSDLSIDKISDYCGFTDRYHFSKMFKKALNITPVQYRKGHVISIS
jgi:AraC-like DNA-binding protein